MKEPLLDPLPPKVDLESRDILRKLAEAHRHLAELKGAVKAIPNEGILIDTLSLQEAKDSSEIENIVTTHDALYLAASGVESVIPAAKEVERYAKALREGFFSVRSDSLICNRLIEEIHGILESSKTGFRKLPGTGLKNKSTGEIIYTPPQNNNDIIRHMSDLERFINDDSVSPLDPLIKMSLIHYQFESIHPFYDGNGRTGRIINVLYLVAKGLLDIPVLYMSRFIIQNKSEYYRLLQAVREQAAWEPWVLFMLTAVSNTARQALLLVDKIRKLMLDTKHRMRDELPKIYSQDLLNNLFRHPYTKIVFVMADLNVTRLTASRYLGKLVEHGFLQKQKIGHTNYYPNSNLCHLLLNIPNIPEHYSNSRL